jgi:hypothetical protein
MFQQKEKEKTETETQTHLSRNYLLQFHKRAESQLTFYRAVEIKKLTCTDGTGGRLIQSLWGQR